MRVFFARAMLGVLVLAMLTGALVRAQPAEPTAQPIEAACDDPVRLSGQVATLYLSLIDLRERLQAGDQAALGDLYTVGQHYQAFALECGHLPDDVDGLVVNSTDVARVLEVLATLSGDPLRGQLLYDGAEPTASGDVLGCMGCHAGGQVAPLTEGTWTRWDEERSREERFAAYTFEQYAVESILLPWDYFVETYPQFTMPDFYPEQLSYQDLADLLAYLESQDQLP
jgi:hypothetical protein